MDYSKDYLPLVKSMVDEKRYIHTLGVIDEAIKYSKIYNQDIEKARIAASLHDITKNFTQDENIELLKKYYNKSEIDSLPRSVMHSYSAFIYSKEYLGIDDIDILNAIKNHTLSRPAMSDLEKIIYLSDFTDPSRNLDYSNHLRDIANRDLNLAMKDALIYTVSYLKEGNKVIPKITYDALNYYKEFN